MSALNIQDKARSEPSSGEPTNRIGIYVRTFSATGGFAEIQEKRVREKIADMNRYRPLGEVVEVFRDHGLCHDTFSRPGFLALLRAIRRKQVTLVMVPEFHDLMALQRDLPRILRVFLRHRCGLRSLQEYLLYEDLSVETSKPVVTAKPAPTESAAVTVASGGSEN